MEVLHVRLREQAFAVNCAAEPGISPVSDFDAVFGRIRERGLQYWADPGRRRPGEINHNDGGRGVYFPDPDDHYLEVITRPYGSGSS